MLCNKISVLRYKVIIALVTPPFTVTYKIYSIIEEQIRQKITDIAMDINESIRHG